MADGLWGHTQDEWDRAVASMRRIKPDAGPAEMARRANNAVLHGLCNAYHSAADPTRGLHYLMIGDSQVTPAYVGRLIDGMEEQNMHFPPDTGADFEMPPAGTHVGYCYRVIDIGTHMDSWQGQERPRRKLLIQWELADCRMQDGRPFSVTQRYTFSQNERSKLRHDLETWRGRMFTEPELASFRIDSVLGHPLYLQLIHKPSQSGRTYCNISAVMKPPPGLNPYTLVNEPFFLSLEPGSFDPVAFSKLSENLQATIASSPEYQHLGGTMQQGQPAGAQPAAQPQQTGAWPQSSAAPGNGAQQQPAAPLPDPGATPPAGMQPTGTTAMQPANVPPAAPPPAGPGDYGAAWGGDDDDPIPFAPCKL